MRRKVKLQAQAMAVWRNVNSKEVQRSFSKSRVKKPAIAKRMLGLSLQQLRKNRRQKLLSPKESQKKHEYQLWMRISFILDCMIFLVRKSIHNTSNEYATTRFQL